MKRSADAETSPATGEEEIHFDVSTIHPSPPTQGTFLDGKKAYEEMYKRSIESPIEFWDEQAKNLLTWFSPFETVQHGSLAEGNVAWFLNGKINVSYNCIDRHLAERGEETAIIWEGDEPG